MRLKTLVAAITTALLLGGCAGDMNEVKQDVESATVPVSAQASIDGCLRIQRDLTVSWQQRHYWCGNEIRRDALEHHNIRFLSSGNIVRTSEIQRHSRSLVDKQRLAKPVNGSPVTDRMIASSEKQHDLDTDVRIYYARHRETLGPKGAEKVISLMPAARRAGRVTLLGLYEPDELQSLEPSPELEERFSVGRSLSVRERWRAEGLDVSNVTILHHTKNRNGRYIEVKFHD